MKFTMGGYTSRLERMAAVAKKSGMIHDIIRMATCILDEYDDECRTYGSLAIILPRRMYDEDDAEGAWVFFGYDGFSEEDDCVRRVFNEWDYQYWENRYASHVTVSYAGSSLYPYPKAMVLDSITIERAFPLIRMLHDRLGIKGAFFTPSGEYTRGVTYGNVCRYEEKYAWAVKELAGMRKGL